MKIVIDFRMHQSSGIGTYMKNIVPYFIDLYDVILLGKSTEISKYDFFSRVTVVECTSNIYSIKEQLELFNKIPECDIFWSPHYNIPLLPIKAKKRIVTIHDVFHLAFYNTLGLKQKIYAKFVINQAVKRSNLVLTDSVFSKNEIFKYTGHITNTIVGCSIDTNKFNLINDIDKLNKVREKYSLPIEFLLFVGNVKPHKNIKNLLFALNDTNYHLVIVGKKDGFITGDNGIANLIKNDKIKDRIHFTGYVEDEDIPIIYNLAKLFIFPSLYEGFGIPPLEAQACGIPVICSSTASLPEVGGVDSVLYIDPYNPDDIKEKILALMNDEDLQKELIRKGFENVKRFSWEKSAKKIIDILERLK